MHAMCAAYVPPWSKIIDSHSKVEKRCAQQEHMQTNRQKNTANSRSSHRARYDAMIFYGIRCTHNMYAYFTRCICKRIQYLLQFIVRIGTIRRNICACLGRTSSTVPPPPNRCRSKKGYSAYLWDRTTKKQTETHISVVRFVLCLGASLLAVHSLCIHATRNS